MEQLQKQRKETAKFLMPENSTLSKVIASYIFCPEAWVGDERKGNVCYENDQDNILRYGSSLPTPLWHNFSLTGFITPH